jgi:hypothetical protein
MRRNVLIVAPGRTPYVAAREQSPSFEAPSSPRPGALRRQSPSRAGLAPYRILGAAGLRRDCQVGGGYRKPEVGRTQLRSGGAMLPRLG